MARLSYPSITLKSSPRPRMNVPPSIIEQIEQTLRNIEVVLHEAGGSISDIVRVDCILVDRKEFSLVWPTLEGSLRVVRPAATMIQAGLAEEVMRIEIEVTAIKEG